MSTQKLKQETDPNGIDAHTKGAKLDAGKVQPELIIRGFARSLLEVAKVATYGANKYTEDGWEVVPNGKKRYANAGLRHKLKRYIGQTHDSDTKIMHLAHEAWNILAELELTLRELEKEPNEEQDNPDVHNEAVQKWDTRVQGRKKKTTKATRKKS